MPINIAWDDEDKTTIICRSEGDFALPNDMATAFREVDVLARTIEHEVGVIMDWTQFQPSISDSSMPELRTDGRRSILRGDFGSSGTAQPSTIAITVFVFSATISKEMKTVFSQMINITKNQARFVIASSLEEAREIIANHFQRGDTNQES